MNAQPTAADALRPSCASGHQLTIGSTGSLSTDLTSEAKSTATAKDMVGMSEEKSSLHGMKFMIISGTNRIGSVTRRISCFLLGIYQRLGTRAELLDLATLPTDVFLPTAFENRPASFDPFARAMLEADALHFLLPEYRSGFPAALKQLIDLVDYEAIERKPIALTGIAAGNFGAIQPVQALQTILLNAGGFIYPLRTCIPHVHELLADDGQLKNPRIEERLHRQIAGFIDFAGRLRIVQPDWKELPPSGTE